MTMEEVARLAGAPDTLKSHRGFVTNRAHDHDLATIAKSIIELTTITDKLMDRITRLEKIVDRLREDARDIGDI